MWQYTLMIYKGLFLGVTLTRLSLFPSKEQDQIYQKILCWISNLWSRWHISLVSEAMILKFLVLLYVCPACDPECSNSACSQKETDGRLKLRYLIYKGTNYKGLSKVWGHERKDNHQGCASSLIERTNRWRRYWKSQRKSDVNLRLIEK